MHASSPPNDAIQEEKERMERDESESEDEGKLIIDADEEDETPNVVAVTTANEAQALDHDYQKKVILLKGIFFTKKVHYHLNVTILIQNYAF